MSSFQAPWRVDAAASRASLARGRGVGRLRRIVVWLVTCVILGVFNFPLLNTLMTSVKQPADIVAVPPKMIFRPVWSNYLALFSDPTVPYGRYLVNTIVIAVGAALLTVLVTLPAGFVIARFGTGRRVLFPVISSLRAIPYVVFAVPIYIMFQRARLIDTPAALILINTAVNVPLALVLFSVAVREIPLTLEEAARIDGCSTWGVFRYVVVPLSGPIAASVGILSFIGTWNEFLFGLLLTVERATPVTVGTTMFITSWTIKWGSIAAALVLGTLPIVAFATLAQRYLVRGLTAGAIKG